MLEDRLEQEAKRNTAVIMSRLELCAFDEVTLSLLRKHVGDVLHDSRRALVKEFVDKEADIPKPSDHRVVYESAH